MFVLLGTPVAPVKAPALFNAELADRGVDAVLVPLEVSARDLQSVFGAMAAVTNVDGLLVTMPHKTAVVELCDDVGSEARDVGAANAVRFGPRDESCCEMFDGAGLVGALDAADVRLADAHVLLAGCGGAGSAIAFALARRPMASLTLFNRTASTAHALADRLRRCRDVRVEVGPAHAAGHQVVINATRLGMNGSDPAPVDLSGAEGCTVVVIAPGDERSWLLRQADGLGLPTLDAEDMLRAQIVPILEFWGRVPVADRLRRGQ